MRQKVSAHRRNRRQLIQRNILVFLLLLFLNSIKSLAAEPEQIVYEGPIFIEEQVDFYPKELLEEGGKIYQLISAELRDIEKTGTLTYVSTTIPYELEGSQKPPESAVITLQDEVSGQTYEREVFLQEIEEKGTIWREDFSFPITVYGYEADVFFLGGQEISAGTDLAEYGWLFLEYLDLPEDCYRIEAVEWDGESYEQEGTLCRDAIAYGEKMVRMVDVLYGGQVRTPNVPAKQYVAVYQELMETVKESENATVESTERTAEIDESGQIVEEIFPEEALTDRILRWIREHITVVVFSGLFIVGLAAWVLLLYEAGKKRKAGD